MDFMFFTDQKPAYFQYQFFHVPQLTLPHDKAIPTKPPELGLFNFVAFPVFLQFGNPKIKP
jgi:hypothetical protein